MSVLFVSVLSGFILLFLIKRYHKPIFTLSEASLKILDSLLIPEETDEKVKLVEKNLTRLLAALVRFFALILMVLVAAALPLIILDQAFEIKVDLSSWYFLLGISLGSIIPFIPVQKKDDLSYSELSKLFHRLFLDNYNVSKKLFQIEKKRYLKAKTELNQDFVMVSGLARAGTTAFMLGLNEIKAFKSLDYSNMPLILGPNIWKKFYSPKGKKKKERAHADGIQVGLNSAEALEEYFFKAHLNDSYIQENALEKHSIQESDYQSYIEYQNLLLKEKGDRYLTKNNNALLRYESLRSQNPNFLCVFMYRHPLQHAYSLLKQHRQYLAMQQKDAFVLEYMNWLGHHEFGMGQRVFHFAEEAEPCQLDKNSLDYWLVQWTNYYQYLLTIPETNKTKLISYEDFCQQPTELLNHLLDGISIDQRVEAKPSFQNSKEIKEAYSDDILAKALGVYEDLNRRKMRV
jgi:hypothetical protein